jgi:hypothetical protein
MIGRCQGSRKKVSVALKRQIWRICLLTRHTVPSLFYVSLCLIIYTVGMDTLADRLARYDREHEFLRQLTIPEEDRRIYTSARWTGEYRWFRSPNVVDLVAVQRVLRADVTPRPVA